MQNISEIRLQWRHCESKIKRRKIHEIKKRIALVCTKNKPALDRLIDLNKTSPARKFCGSFENETFG